MPDRPYYATGIEALEALVARSQQDENVLRAVQDELGHRNTVRSRALKERVARHIVALAFARARGEAGPVSPPPGHNGVHRSAEGVSVEPARPGPEAAAVTLGPADAQLIRPAPERVPDPIRPEDAPLHQQLDRMRRRLLDLTAKNRLLNFRHTPASCVRLIDEVPSQVFERITAGEAMEFVPLRPEEDDDEEELELPLAAEPGAAVATKRDRHEAKLRSIAIARGLDPSYELPALELPEHHRHRDKALQTLVLPEDLESVLRKVHQKARTAIQETGANVLHLVFGFVEWSDVPAEQATRSDFRLAPLVLVPVAIERGRLDGESRPRTYLYTVKATGEDWDTNVTLQEKCRRELNAELPGIGDGEGLETYFSRIEGWLEEHTAGWELRRGVTLGLVSFGKILMWRDLDSNTWPRQGTLVSNPLLREVLGEDLAPADAPEQLTGEYQIDSPPPDVEVPPVVVDADSSQHSVLVEVAKGTSLVVQGPPGTGKSQTIANLIAAEIHRGKRVLFVAEKKAALDVVHRRLAKIGLGPYCLALHSHTSDKKAFLNDLGERIRVRGAVRYPRDLATVQQELDQHRARLNEYVHKLNAKHPKLELTGFEVLWRARRLLDPLSPEAHRVIADARAPAALEFTRQQLEEAKAVLRDFGANTADVLAECGALGAHPWFGVTNPDLTQPEIEQLLEAARRWAAAIEALDSTFEAVDRAATVAVVRSLTQLVQLHEKLSRVEVPPLVAVSKVPMRVLQSRRESALMRALEAVHLSRETWGSIEGPWGRPGALTHETADRFTDAISSAVQSFGEQLTTGESTRLAARVHHDMRAAESVERLALSLEKILDRAFSRTPRVIERLLKAVQSAASVSTAALELRSEPLRAEGAEAELVDLAATAARLASRREELARTWPVALRPDVAALRKHIAAMANAPRFLPGVFSGQYRVAVSTFRTATGRRAKRDEMQRELRSVLEFEDEAARFAASPALVRLLGPAARGIDSPLAAALESVRWLRCVEEFGRGIGVESSKLQDAAWNVAAPLWREAAAWSVQESAATNVALSVVEALSALCVDLKLNDRSWPDMPLDQVRRELDGIARVLDAASEAFANAGAADDQTLRALRSRLELVRSAWKRDESARPLIAELGRVEADASDLSACAEVGAALSYVTSLRDTGIPEAALGPLLNGRQTETLDTFRARVVAAFECATTMRSTAERFADIATLDAEAWLGRAASRMDDAPVALIRERLQVALASEKSVYIWARYVHARTRAVAAGGEQVCKLVDARRLPAATAAEAFEAAAYGTVANAIVQGDAGLLRFSGTAHEQMRARFAELDEKSLELTAEFIAHSLASTPGIPGNGYGAVRDLTDEALIRHHASQQRPRVTIRDLFRRAGRAIVNLKPCLMMSPQAIAQYLPPGVMEFDLVVMDEASQIRPEDALGAIARAKQMVVVGDPMQLGPTSFFDRQMDDDDDGIPDEDTAEGAQLPPPEAGPTVLERSESILTAAQARYPLRMLRWHYRSRHPKLIAFSNREFYGEDLIVFPTPEFAGSKEGVFFRKIAGAVYEGHRNVKEAEAVVEAVRKHAVEHPGQTLLVATLNYHQADLIDELLQKAEKLDPALAEYRRLHADGPEPLDVKNLENVQGDERDVILVSITFGPKPNGQFSRNFGPINQAGGERRLNVLFTRAKHRVEVFCSFEPRQLGVSDASPRGLRVLHDYLRYAEDGAWATGAPDGREPDSDFEVAVARALRARGFEVHPQVGIAGYRIDLGVVHPEHPGTYVLGVECDGASYHSARSARDRDRLRQRVLEGYGWNIHRIWSTDWFRDPGTQLELLLAKVQGTAGRPV